MKKIDASAHIGDAGIALIHQLVNKMGFVWHERKLDAGIDGEIELRNPVTGEVANRTIFVQSKASNQKFRGENARSFYFVCKPSDVDYWMSADIPILLICSHPQTDEAWWMHVQGWFRDPAHRASGRIDFDKRTQRFDATTAHRLLNLADPHGQAHVPVAEHRQETLTSNLLPVAIPDVIYSAPTEHRQNRDVIAAQRASGMVVRHDFILRDGRLYCWLPPEATALASAVSGPTDALGTTDWATSADPARQRALVQLLNFALRQDLIEDCEWHAGRKVLYFRATPDMKPRTVRSVSERNVLVFNPKYRKDEPKRLSYCKHAALEWQFLQFDDEWFCALTPTYHYTRDGYRDSLFLSEYLTGIKSLERNPAVYGQTRMWATVLHGQLGVIDPRETLLAYGELATCTADRSINDSAWLFDPRKVMAEPGDDSAEGHEQTEIGAAVGELTLFEVEA